MRKISIVAAALLIASSASAATVYKCKGTDGELHYQSMPCSTEEQSVGSWQLHGGSGIEAASGVGADSPLVLGQGPGGHYFVDGAVNGQYVHFLIDTGATSVTIPLALASAAGIRCQSMSAMQTANGVTRSCMATIEKLTFGHFTLSYVDAAVVPNLGQPLLGMNVLKRFHIEQDGQQMRISRNY